MGFFEKLFKKNTENFEQEDIDFTREFKDASARYLNYPGADIDFEVKDKSGKIQPLNIVFKDTYNEWKGVVSVWDRRSIIYQALDAYYLNNTDKWKIMERYIVDRYPQNALKYINDFGQESDFNDADILTSMARALLFMDYYEEGLTKAEKALSLNPDLKRAQIAKADLLHLIGKQDEAHEIYTEILKNSKLSDLKKSENSVMEIIGFHNDILNSSIYAAGLLSSGNFSEEVWDEVAGEFYYSPYFRSKHAYWLMEHNQVIKGVVKLISLAQEFPKFKEGAINAHSAIEQLRVQTGDKSIFTKEYEYLSKLISKYQE